MVAGRVGPHGHGGTGGQAGCHHGVAGVRRGALGPLGQLHVRHLARRLRGLQLVQAQRLPGAAALLECPGSAGLVPARPLDEVPAGIRRAVAQRRAVDRGEPARPVAVVPRVPLDLLAVLDLEDLGGVAGALRDVVGVGQAVVSLRLPDHPVQTLTRPRLELRVLGHDVTERDHHALLRLGPHRVLSTGEEHGVLELLHPDGALAGRPSHEVGQSSATAGALRGELPDLIVPGVARDERIRLAQLLVQPGRARPLVQEDRAIGAERVSDDRGLHIVFHPYSSA